MESQEKFQSYNDVNKEIQALIASRENRPYRETTYRTDDSQNILSLLESLNRTYSEINAALKTENSQALKDVILKSDIKMSMVCETLLDTLKKTTEEKNTLIQENQNLEKTKRDLESVNINNRIQIDKIQNELEFKKGNVEELNRIIRDQKDRMNEFKMESFKAKNEVQFFKTKIDELENLRNRASERMSVYERELDALNTVIKDKEVRIQTLIAEKREEEEKNANVKTKISELESLVDVMNKKMEIKDKNMTLCNSELSKVLCENKKYKVEYEKYKESSVYYEGLYNSVSSQNAYLNDELNKMLKMAEYTKDVEGFINKFKRKLKRKKKALKKLERENKELKEKLEDNNESKIADETSDSLMKKIEELNGNNSRFKRQIEELENEKKQLENKLKNMRIGTDPTSTLRNNYTESKSLPNFDKDKFLQKTPGIFSNNPVYGSTSKYFTQPSSNEKTTMHHSRYSNINPVNTQSNFNRINNNVFNRNTDINSIHTQSNHNPINNLSNARSINNDVYSLNRETVGPYSYYLPKPEYPVSSSNLLRSNHLNSEYANLQNKQKDNENNATYLKLFNLENEYDENKQKDRNDVDRNDFIGGFINADDSVQDKAVCQNPPTEMAPVNSLINRGSVNMKETSNFDMFDLKQDDHKKMDDASVESIKTYHTSSTLKDMMARTDNLQKKFQDLENKLAQFNEGDSIDKLTDKIKTYNSYYSEWNAESNESDYI